MSIAKKTIYRLLFFIFVTINLAASEFPQLDQYIQLGLQDNLALKQQQFSLEKSMAALRQAKSMFLPSIAIEARYSKAGGGRVIDMPIGDLVNPIHTTLNKLLATHGLIPAFPANIENQHIPFLRKTEQDTKLRLIQPLFQPAIYYNYKIKKDLSEVDRAQVNAYKRQLITTIKTAYFNYLKAVKVKELLQNTGQLLEENLHLNESLFKNNKCTEDAVFLAQAEISKLEQQQAEAEKNVHMAAAYFNFLLNRSLDETIIIPDAPPAPADKTYDCAVLTEQALRRRNEFQQLQAAITAADHAADLHQSSVLPTVSAVFDYGIQGESYRLRHDDDYWMGSLVFSWNLFRGGQDKAQKEQALCDKKRLETQFNELENQVKLQVREAFDNLTVARKAIASCRNTLKSCREAFLIISRKYEEGMVPQIEYLKARNDFTNAGIADIIAGYDYFGKEAALELAAATADLNQ